MPCKGKQSNRERKKDKKYTRKGFNVYSKKHIRMKEKLLAKTNKNITK
tara:strand:- start:154 stop:297 length:144 start_codon:yes stop_codon:yes gene_type:complete